MQRRTWSVQWDSDGMVPERGSHHGVLACVYDRVDCDGLIIGQPLPYAAERVAVPEET